MVENATGTDLTIDSTMSYVIGCTNRGFPLQIRSVTKKSAWVKPNRVWVRFWKCLRNPSVMKGLHIIWAPSGRSILDSSCTLHAHL